MVNAISIAARADNDITRVENAGLGQSQSVLGRIRSSLVRVLASRGAYQYSVQAELLNHLAPVLAKMMAVAHLMGQRRELLIQQQAGLKPIVEEIALDRFSEVMRNVRAAGLGKDLTRLQRGYARRVYDSMRNMGANIDATTRGVIASLIADNEPQGRAMQILRATLDKLGVGDIGQSKLETIYRTEAAMAYQAGRWSQAIARWNDIWGFRYVTMRDDRVRPEHAALDATTLQKDSPFWQSHWPPNGWNCVTEDTLVSGRVQNASRMYYEGPIIEIQTVHGRKLTITPNHRVATTSGLRAANTLCQGDDLINDSSFINGIIPCTFDRSITTPQILRDKINKNHAPARIKNVFDTFRAIGAGTISSKLTSLDFNGDARFGKGQIDVVWPDSLLPNNFFLQSIFQEILKLKFKLALPIAQVDFGSVCASSSFFDSSFSSSNFIPRFAALLSNYLSVVRQLFAQRPLDKFCIGLSSEIDVCLSKPAGDCATSDAQFLRELQDRFSGRIITDKILNIRAFNFKGHVYDLQCEGGYIIANGLLISNCRCQIATIYKVPGYKPKAKQPGKINGRVPLPEEGFRFNVGERFEQLQAVEF